MWYQRHVARAGSHTNFCHQSFKEFETETSGEFGGLYEITVQNDILTVISPIEDTPLGAGVLAGDRIVEINGESTKVQSRRGGPKDARQKGIEGSNWSFSRGFRKPKEFVMSAAQ